MLELELKGPIGNPPSFSWSPLRGPDYFFYAFDSLPFDRMYAFQAFLGILFEEDNVHQKFALVNQYMVKN